MQAVTTNLTRSRVHVNVQARFTYNGKKIAEDRFFSRPLLAIIPRIGNDIRVKFKSPDNNFRPIYAITYFPTDRIDEMIRLS
jgi:hypothetical protein